MTPTAYSVLHSTPSMRRFSPMRRKRKCEPSSSRNLPACARSSVYHPRKHDAALPKRAPASSRAGVVPRLLRSSRYAKYLRFTSVGHSDRAVRCIRYVNELRQICPIVGNGRRAFVGAGERPQVGGHTLVNYWSFRLLYAVIRSRLPHGPVRPGNVNRAASEKLLPINAGIFALSGTRVERG